MKSWYNFNFWMENKWKGINYDTKNGSFMSSLLTPTISGFTLLSLNFVFRKFWLPLSTAASAGMPTYICEGPTDGGEQRYGHRSPPAPWGVPSDVKHIILKSSIHWSTRG